MSRIPLGSGNLYMTQWPSNGVIPDDATIETTANLLGEVKGGGVIAYAKEVYTAKSDNGKAQRTVTTSETVTITTGVMTTNSSLWQRLIGSAKVTEDSVNKKRTIKIGGSENESGIVYLVRFVQIDPLYGNVRFTIKGTNTGGFEWNAQQTEETVLNGVFTAEPLDDTGAILQIDEDTSKEA